MTPGWVKASSTLLTRAPKGLYRWVFSPTVQASSFPTSFPSAVASESAMRREGLLVSWQNCVLVFVSL